MPTWAVIEASFGMLRLVWLATNFSAPMKQGGVAGCEQLLRVGRSTAGTTEFFRGGEFDVEDVVTGNRTTVTAASGGCDCGVESLHGVSLVWI